MNTHEFWRGEFGDAYLKRNQVDWKRRIPFWATVMIQTNARSVYEVGTNAGWNLSAIRRITPDVGIHGCEINPRAAMRAVKCGLPVSCGAAQNELAGYDGAFDLVFTAGVLIHVGPDDIEQMMSAIVKASARYVLAVEYEADQEEEVEYRGHAGKLWRRPFGKLYEDMGLRIVRKWQDVEGFDRCSAWLLEKSV